MLVPSWVVSAINWMHELVPGGDQLPTLSPLLAYPLTWLATAFALGVLGFVLGLAIIAPIGSAVREAGYAITTRASSGCDLKDRIRYATKGRTVQNVGNAIRRAGNRAAGATWVLPPDWSPNTMVPPPPAPSVRFVRAVTKVGTVLVSFADLFRLLVKAAVRPSLLNLIRWLIVVIYLNPTWIAGTSWQQLAQQVKDWIEPSVIGPAVAIFGVLCLLIGSFWRRGHKWTVKFHEATASKRMEFLNQSIRPLDQVVTALYELGRKCEAGALFSVRDVVADVTHGSYTIGSDWKPAKDGEKTPFRRSPGSLLPVVQSTDLAPAIAEFSKAFKKLDQENLSEFLISSLPPRLRFEFWVFDSTLQHWGATGKALELPSIEDHVRENSLMKSIRENQMAGAVSNRSEQRWVPRDTDVPHLLDSAVKEEYEHVDGLLLRTAESIAVIQSITQYARRETRSSWLQRFLGNR